MSSRTQSRARAERPPAGDSRVVRFDPKQQASKLVEALEARRDQIAQFLGSDERVAERFISVATDSVVRGGDLLQADLLSLVNSIRHAAIMGLEPTSIMGEGAIVVYRDSGQGGKKIAQFQPMVRGLSKLARNSGEIAAIGCDVVRKKDHFVFRSGSDPAVDHEPYLKGFTGDEDPGEVVGAYAFVKLRNGELIPMLMSTADIFKRRQVSKSWQNSGETSVWGMWPEEMMKKTVLRRLLVEKVPLSAKAQVALALDAEIDKPDGDPDKVEARVTRTQRRLLDVGDLEAAENGSGDAQGGDAGNEAPGDAAGGSVDPSPPSDDAGTSDGETSVICAAPGMAEGVSCDLAKGHPGPHQSGASEWL